MTARADTTARIGSKVQSKEDESGTDSALSPQPLGPGDDLGQ